VKDQEYFPDNPIEVPKYTAEGTLSYKDAEKGGLPIVKGKLPKMNIFTKTENWFIWDNGKSQLWGVKEDDPNNNHELYKGSGVTYGSPLSRTDHSFLPQQSSLKAS
jgi:hypothetical protein